MPSFAATQCVDSAVIYSTALLLLPSVVSGQGQFGCESGLRYYLATRLNWADAVAACEANAGWGHETGMLASIRTPQDRDEVLAIGVAPTIQGEEQTVPTFDDVWIGATRREDGGVGDWRWISTNETFFSNNAVVAPQTLNGFGPNWNPSPGEDYAALEPTDRALPWVPRVGTALNPYLCEMCQLPNAAPRRCSNAALKTYRVVRDPQLGWADAQLACRGAAGTGQMGNLATVRTDAENTLLVQFFGGTIDENVWIGVTDSAEEGNWRWVDNNELFYTGTDGVFNGSYQAGQQYQGWADAAYGWEEPNDAKISWDPNADYAAIMVQKARRWGDSWAQTQLASYVCETFTFSTIDNISTYARDCTVESCEPGFAPNTKRDTCCTDVGAATYGDNCEVISSPPTPSLTPTLTLSLTPSLKPTLTPTSEQTATPTSERTTMPTSERASEPTPEPTEEILALATDDGFNYLWLLLLLIPCCSLVLAALALVRRRSQKPKARSKHVHFDAKLRDEKLDHLMALNSQGPGPLRLKTYPSSRHTSLATADTILTNFKILRLLLSDTQSTPVLALLLRVPNHL